jgi:endo-alpha-1,4-polygalactosaminidase (GH114 family)
MNTAFSAAQRSYDNRLPDEEYEGVELDLIDTAIQSLQRAKSAFNRTRPEWETARGYVADAMAVLGEIQQ